MIGATNGSFGAVWGVLLVVVRGVIGATVGFFGVDLGSEGLVPQLGLVGVVLGDLLVAVRKVLGDTVGSWCCFGCCFGSRLPPWEQFWRCKGVVCFRCWIFGCCFGCCSVAVGDVFWWQVFWNKEHGE